MASDEIVWSVIAHQFCSFKLKTTKDATFCRNEYNVTGLCNRQSCPLANSRYATVRSENGILYLYQKTIERAHMPSKQWERIKLSENYTKALAQIDERLIYWPSWLIHKCKQRLTRLTQVAIRTRRMAIAEMKMGEKLVPTLAPKIRRREATRERKALAAAKLERSIEKELIERLKSGAYGEQPLNVEEGIWKKVLKGLERGGDAERDVDYDEEEEEEEEEEEMEGEVEYVSGDEELEEDELADLEDWLGEEGSGASEFEEDDEDDDESDSEIDSSEEEDSGDEAEDDEEQRKKGKKGPTGPKKPLETGKKRKLETQPPKSRKKRGPRVEIEYEDNVPLQRELAV